MSIKKITPASTYDDLEKITQTTEIDNFLEQLSKTQLIAKIKAQAVIIGKMGEDSNITPFNLMKMLMEMELKFMMEKEEENILN